MQEEFNRAPYSYSIKKLNICSIPISLGLEDDILLILTMSPKFWVNQYNRTLFTFLHPGDLRILTKSFKVSCSTLGGLMSIFVTTTNTGTLRYKHI